MSKGNYFKDVNGNVLLDLNCRNEGLILGHNHNAIVHGVKNDILRRILYYNVRVPIEPKDDYADFVRQIVMPIAPEGMTDIHIGGGMITYANESAISVAMAKYAKDHGKPVENLCALGFENGYYGNSATTLSCSDPQVNVKNVERLDWPVAPFPRLLFPLAPNEKANI